MVESLGSRASGLGFRVWGVGKVFPNRHTKYSRFFSMMVQLAILKGSELRVCGLRFRV